MKKTLCATGMLLCFITVAILHPIASAYGLETSAGDEQLFTLTELIDYAIEHSPALKISSKSVEAEKYGVSGARGEMMPRLDGQAAYTRYRYPTSIMPVVLSPPVDFSDLPDFERNIYDAGLSLKIPLFRGGRLVRGLSIAQLRKLISEDNYVTTKQELVYNVTTVYYKILQTGKLLATSLQAEKQLETHRKNVKHFLDAGTVPKLDLLKTEVELARAKEKTLMVRNNMENAGELLKTLIGLDDMKKNIMLAEEKAAATETLLSEDADIEKALELRSDYKAIKRKKEIAGQRVKAATGRWFPEISAVADYSGRAGDPHIFKENWSYGIRMTVPIFEGGIISAEVGRERAELAKAHEEERQLRFSLIREVKEAHLNIAYAQERTVVAGEALESARENLRIESLKYETGSGTTSDVLDAQTGLVRAESDYYQAVYDKATALAALKKATGEGLR